MPRHCDTPAAAAQQQTGHMERTGGCMLFQPGWFISLPETHLLAARQPISTSTSHSPGITHQRAPACWIHPADELTEALSITAIRLQQTSTRIPRMSRLQSVQNCNCRCRTKLAIVKLWERPAHVLECALVAQLPTKLPALLLVADSYVL